MADRSMLAPGSAPFGVVYPARNAQPLPTHDARSFALERLKEYLATVIFRRMMNEGEAPKGFRVPVAQIHTYQPDDIVEVRLPSIAFVPGIGTHEVIGLGGPQPIDDSADVYGAGTWLVRMGEYTEPFTIDVVAAKHAIRRAIVAGLLATFRGDQVSTALRLSLPDYYDQAASFELTTDEQLDDPEVVKNRRHARIGVTLTVPEVLLVNGSELKTIIDLGGSATENVLDGSVYLDLDGTPFDPTSRSGACFRDP